VGGITAGRVDQVADTVVANHDRLKSVGLTIGANFVAGFWRCGIVKTKTRPLPFLRSFIAARRWMREATRGRTSVQTWNGRFNEMLCQSAADLAMLMTDTPEGSYPYAGIPGTRQRSAATVS
jgi:hypothetical protein